MSLVIYSTFYVLTCTLNSESCCYFFLKNHTRLLTGSRPSNHHSKLRNTAHLCSTKVVPFHSFRGFFYLQCFFDSFFCASSWKLSPFFLPPFSVKLQFWGIFSWENLFSVSIKVCLKPGTINKSYHRSGFRVFWFPVMFQKSSRESPVFGFKLSWKCKLGYNGSRIRRKSFPFD